jgi:hypothetical protein
MNDLGHAWQRSLLMSEVKPRIALEARGTVFVSGVDDILKFRFRLSRRPAIFTHTSLTLLNQRSDRNPMRHQRVRRATRVISTMNAWCWYPRHGR